MAYFDRFRRRWATTGIVAPPTDAQADAGFAYLGANPPTAELFNALFQDLDGKDGWLFDALAAVLAAAGRTPAAGDPAGLLDALRALFAPAGGAFNVGASGYVQFTSGLMIQWGNGVTVTGSGDVVFYPITFPRASFGQVVMEANAIGWNDAATGNVLPTIFGSRQLDAARFAVHCARLRPSNPPLYSGGTAYFFVAVGW